LASKPRTNTKTLEAFLHAIYRAPGAAAATTTPAVITDPDLNILSCNGVGVEFTERIRQGVSSSGGRLSAPHATPDPIQLAAAAVSSNATGSCVTFRVKTNADNSWLLGSVEKLEFEGAPLLRFGFVHPDDRALPRSEALMHWFGLTPTEAALAIELARGSDVARIAEQRRLSTLTVRTHLKTIFEKTNTHAQRELVALMVRLAAL
jgi:DNA-binding CsgD family transcriptional regulator